jgi:hypothetical protein
MIEYTFPQSIVMLGFCVLFGIIIVAITTLLGKYIDYLAIIHAPEKEEDTYIGPPYTNTLIKEKTTITK